MKQKRILLFIETSRGFGRGIIEGISQYVLERTQWSIFFQDRGMLEELPRWLKLWNGDGIIARTANRTMSQALRDKNIPLVELLGNGDSIPPDISCDNRMIGQMAAEHFRERGFQNLAYYSLKNWYWSDQRRDSFCEAATAIGAFCHVFPIHDRKMVRYTSPSISELEIRRLSSWIRELPKPLGIFAVSDFHARMLIEACKRAKLVIPEEVAILGVDNDSLLCRIGYPQISSIDPNTQRMGFEAALLLDSLIQGGPHPPQNILISPRGVITRQSTDIVAIGNPLMAKVLKYIRDNLDVPLSVKKLSTLFDVSSRTLERRFKETLNCSPEDEIIRLRLERAKMLLRDSNLPIHAISRQTGFSTSEYFSSLFRRKCEMTPSQYRNLYRNNDLR